MLEVLGMKCPQLILKLKWVRRWTCTRGPEGPGGPEGPRARRARPQKDNFFTTKSKIFIFLPRMLRRQTQMTKNGENWPKFAKISENVRKIAIFANFDFGGPNGHLRLTKIQKSKKSARLSTTCPITTSSSFTHPEYLRYHAACSPHPQCSMPHSMGMMISMVQYCT